MVQIKLLLLILLIWIIFSGIVLFISKFEKKSSLPKYFPAIILLAAGVASYVKARYFSEGMQDLAYIVLAMISFGSGVLTLITAAIIDILKNKYIKKRDSD